VKRHWFHRWRLVEERIGGLTLYRRWECAIPGCEAVEESDSCLCGRCTEGGGT
jgi:hypothetical protein